MTEEELLHRRCRELQLDWHSPLCCPQCRDTWNRAKVELATTRSSLLGVLAYRAANLDLLAVLERSAARQKERDVANRKPRRAFSWKLEFDDEGSSE